MTEFILHNYFRSSTSYRARIALNIKKIAYDYKAVHLLKGEQLTPEYLKLNPSGGVPTLIHNGKAIPDSSAIIEYLEEIVPTPALLTKNTYLRARIRQACEIINSSTHPLGNLRVQNYLEKNHGFKPEDKEIWIGHWYDKGLEAMEKTVAEFAGKYCFGDTITMADLFLVPQLLTAERFKMDLTKYPTLLQVYNNCNKLEAFQRAHPFRQPDTPAELRI
ncbi:MAG: maleylacetoacetate isomerase [Bdellovibrionaceae bacterium]|nr:maleylacetoacetate isomerase [Pseudobdellovibrionaceae bacterium]